MANRSSICRFIGGPTTLTVLLLCGCASNTPLPSSGVYREQVFWRPTPAEIQNSSELKAYGHNTCVRYVGAVTFRNRVLNVEMNRTKPGSRDSHLAVAYSWAGSQKIIYTHQPAWALQFIRDLHRILQWPSEIRVISFRYPGVQESTVRLPNGDVEKLYFMGDPGVPWRIMVMRPNHTFVTALLNWARDRRLRSIHLRDSSDGRRWVITLRRQAGAG